MRPSRTFLEQAAADTGYPASSLEKVVMLGDLAGDIARHPFLQEALALKGGTALNLGFGPPSRLSVDLDFNYIGHLDRERMLEDRPKCEDAILDLAQRKGYQVQQSADAFAGRKFYCAYSSAVGTKDRIEIDLNYLFRLPLEPPQRRALWQPGEVDRPQLMMVSITELLIGKLLAFFDRAAIRDIWDVGRLPEIAPEVIKSQRFRAHFIALSATLNHPLHDYTLDRIKERVSTGRIESGLMPMLNASDLKAAEKTVQQAFDVVHPFLSLTPQEQEYINGVSKGRLRLDMLFPEDEQTAARLSKHPALLWKIKNVRRIMDQ